LADASIQRRARAVARKAQGRQASTLPMGAAARDSIGRTPDDARRLDIG